MIKAALFDLDGVVFDTESQYSVFWGMIGREYHPEMPDFALRIKGQTLDLAAVAAVQLGADAAVGHQDVPGRLQRRRRIFRARIVGCYNAEVCKFCRRCTHYRTDCPTCSLPFRVLPKDASLPCSAAGAAFSL